MNGFQLAIGESTIAAFLLTLARTAGFVLVAPPFNSRSVPSRVRTGVAIALALPLSAALQGAVTDAGATIPTLASSALLLQIVGQLFLGAVLGFFILVALSTIQAVGDLLDTVGGFSASMALDPLMLVQTSIMGRLHQLTAVTLLFATDGHLIVLQGLARMVRSLPLVLTGSAASGSAASGSASTGGVSGGAVSGARALGWDALGRAVVSDVANMFLAVVQIGAPVVAAMLVADVALGLLTRAAPALNAFSLSFPLKILFTLLLVGLVLARLPDLLGQLVNHAVLTGVDLVR